MMFNTISWYTLAASEFSFAKSIEKMVFDKRFSEVLKAALPISTASPARLLLWISVRSSCTFLHRRFWLASRILLANNSKLHIFLRFLHQVETSIQGKPNSWCLWAWIQFGMVQFENTWSWVWRAPLAMAAKDMTTVVIWPSFAH